MSKQLSRGKKTNEREERDLDVEIALLEGIIGLDPEWVDALKLLADDYTRRGRVDDGLRVDERLAVMCPEDPMVFYNLACSHSLTLQCDKALVALDRAIRLGYSDFKWLAKDPDMQNLRKDPAFKAFLSRIEPT